MKVVTLRPGLFFELAMHRCGFFILFLLFTTVSSASSAATITLDPAVTAQDALVSAANPANNYGAAGAFGVAAPGLSKGEFQSVLKFDLTSAKASFDSMYGFGGWSLAGAQLRLTAANPNNAIFNAQGAGSFQIRAMQNTTWAEGAGTPNAPGATGITWNTLPSFLSVNDQLLGTYSIGAVTGGNFTFSLGLTSLLTSGVETGSNISLLFSPTAGDTTLAVLFNSRSFNTVASRPQLTLTAQAIPEPSVIGLSFLIGAAGLCWRKARQRYKPTASEKNG